MSFASTDLIHALDIATMHKLCGDDQSVIACAMLAMSVQHLCMVGGQAAATATLTKILNQVGRGDYPEPTQFRRCPDSTVTRYRR
jgi:hypothetical protein